MSEQSAEIVDLRQLIFGRTDLALATNRFGVFGSVA